MAYAAFCSKLTLYSALYSEVQDLYKVSEKTIFIVDRGLIKINPGEEVLKDACPVMLRLLSSLLFKPSLVRATLSRGVLPATAEKIIYNLSLYTKAFPLNNQEIMAIMAKHPGSPKPHPALKGLFRGGGAYNTSNTRHFERLMPSPPALITGHASRPGVLFTPEVQYLVDINNNYTWQTSLPASEVYNSIVEAAFIYPNNYTLAARLRIDPHFINREELSLPSLEFIEHSAMREAVRISMEAMHCTAPLITIPARDRSLSQILGQAYDLIRDNYSSPVLLDELSDQD